MTAATGTAMADLVGNAAGGPDASSTMVGPQVAYSGEAITRSNETVSMALTKTGTNGTAFVNSQGQKLVTRGVATSLGTTSLGHTVEGIWDEFVDGDMHRIQAIWRTTNGGDLLPFNDTANGSAALFLSWNFGVTDPINFHPFWAPKIVLESATLIVSDDGGNSFLDQRDVLGSIESAPWSGSDAGLPLASLRGLGVNWILAEYTFNIPAPGSALCLASLGLALGRRRR
ncbi:MAG: hypothetical protein RBS39_06910 [Phycisphaerales bacterium]|jgi:hypothetical protein|nr:hypothetical protein [Phycisphaerales bacterium]